MPINTRTEERTRTWATFVLAVEALRIVARELEAAGVIVMPVKGIALAPWHYPDVADRSFVDVDLVVSEPDFDVAVRTLGGKHRVSWSSPDLLELNLLVSGFQVEVHGALGRREILDLTTSEVLSRSGLDSDTFGVVVRRIDDLDHILLICANLLKDGFEGAFPHRVNDLRLLLDRANGRHSELLRRASDAGFTTGLAVVADFVANEAGVEAWQTIFRALPLRRRGRVYAGVQRWARRARAPSSLGLLLACGVNDRAGVRRRALTRLARRGLWRLARRDPG
jgi:hypothetical protein